MNNIQLPKSIFCKYKSASHVQGIAVDVEHKFIYVSMTTVLVKITFDGKIVGSVDGLTGHLGCISFRKADGKVYGSIEYKHDSIGKNIAGRTGMALADEDSFYIAIFDCDKIVREGMDAEKDDVMVATYLPDVVEDYLYEDKEVKHRYGCSGIDGTAVGFAPKTNEEVLLVSYGIYGDTNRTDNDDQVILQFDLDELNAKALPLSQLAPHHSGLRCSERYFVYTGNTTYGIQNLEYDAYTGDIFAAVYRGKKEQFPNYALYRIDGAKAATPTQDGKRLCLKQDGSFHATSGVYGYDFEYGSTGLAALGDGYYYISHEGCGEDGLFFTEIKLYKYVGGNLPFELV